MLPKLPNFAVGRPEIPVSVLPVLKNRFDKDRKKEYSKK